MKPKNPDNLQMVDFAARDPRSYSRMLRGCGDGREKLWLEFEQKFGAFFTEEDLQRAFSQACRRAQPPAETHIGKLLLILLILIAIVF